MRNSAECRCELTWSVSLTQGGCLLQFVRAVMGRWPKAVLQFEVRSF